SMRVSDELPVIDLDALVPMRVVADHDVGAPVDGFVPDDDRIIRGRHVGIGHWLSLVLLAPVKLHDHDVGKLAGPLDARLQRRLVDPPADSVESDEAEFYPSHVKYRPRPETRAQD